MLSKRSVILAASILTAAAGTVTAAMFAPDSIVYSREIKHGNEIVRSIDVFQKREGRLPSSLSEVGITDNDQERYFFQACAGGQYIIWFDTRLGKSMVYGSANHEWDPFNHCSGAAATP
jgi:hypothetical protein